MKNVKLKVCGMKHNTVEVAKLQPDYLGFIFYDKSPRVFEDTTIPLLPSSIKKVGVFVNATIDYVLANVIKYNLDVIQLHGEESPDYCEELKSNHLDPTRETVEVWKVFSIKDSFDFTVLLEYESVVDKFLFDTKGKEKGGNGYTFDWTILNDYNSKKPFILSGGIGLGEIDQVKELVKTGLPIVAIDVNSRFEDKPGVKNIEKLKALAKALKKLKN